MIYLPFVAFFTPGRPAVKRPKTTYPGVFYREAERIGGNGLERVYYIVFKPGGKVFEEKVGRQFSDLAQDEDARRKMGLRARQFAEAWLGRDKIMAE